MLEDDLEEDDFFRDGLEQEREWIRNFRTKRSLSRKETGDSSRYSFSTEYSSGR